MKSKKFTKILTLTVVAMIFGSILFSTQNNEYTNEDHNSDTKDNLTLNFDENSIPIENDTSLKISSSETFIRAFDEVQVNHYITNYQWQSSICALSSDKYAVVWQSWEQDGSLYGVYARLFNATTGENITSEFRINYKTDDTQSMPSICALSSDTFAVAWTSGWQDGDYLGVYASVFNATTGKNITSEFQVNYKITDSQSDPSIYALSSDRFVVAWSSHEQDGDSMGVYARVFNATTCENLTSEFRINYNITGNQWIPSICGLSNDKFAVAWRSEGQDGYGDGIYARVFNATTGENITSEFRVNNYILNDQNQPSICALSSEKFAVAWSSDGQDGSGYGVYASIFNATTGENVTSEFRINDLTADNQRKPSICALSSDRLAVSWASWEQDGSGYDVYASIFNATTGENVTSEFRINDQIINDQWPSSICALSSESFALAWTSNEQDGSDLGVYSSVFKKVSDSSGAFEWIWMSGNKTTNENGVYGTKGVPNSANYPGSREQMTSWTDLEGNLWLFGGWGYPESGANSRLNDLWRYDITSNMWTWMSGNKTCGVSGVYGTKGVPNAANYPGCRHNMASWTDLDGNLWLFGGYGSGESGVYGKLNDLWRYNTTSNLWTWMSGNKMIEVNGIYGTKGIPSASNYPGSRAGMVSWTDLDGDLWLFGGWSYEGSSNGHSNALWRYNITSDMWTWMSGNNTLNENGEYGTKGIPNAANYPGSRSEVTSWTDSDGDLWLFGGSGYAEIGGGFLNDLWRYDIASNMWTWMSGHKTDDRSGSYGTKGVPNAANYPGSRIGVTSQTDFEGNLWLFGGYGYGYGYGELNDLWRYNITSDMWTWISGNKSVNVNGVYGTKRVASESNYPGARRYMTSWIDLDGNFWLFGGDDYDEAGGWDDFNDLWRFGLSPTSIEDDDYEENEWIYNAYNLSSYENTWLSSIDGFGVQLDEDWFEIYASGEDRLIVDLRFTHADGNIDIEVYDGSGILLITGNYSSSDNEIINYVLPSSGTYYLRIYGEDQGNSYNLIWSIEPIGPPPESFTLYSDASPVENDGSFRLNWDLSTYADDYSVYVSDSEITVIDSSCTEIESGLEILYHDITDLSTGEYYYVVVAYNTFGETISNCVHITVQRIPTSFELTNDANDPDDDGTFTLNWDLSTYADNYSVFVSNSEITAIDSSCTEIASGLEILFHNIDVLPTGDYYYVVVAYNEFGEAISNCVHITVHRIPTSFELTTDAEDPDADSTFYLNWTVSTYATNYSIYTSNTTITEYRDNLTLIAQGLTNQSYFVNISTNGIYYYIVIAYNEYGNATSNCIDILVDDPTNIPPNGDDDDDDDDPPDDNTIPGFIYIIIILIVLGLISIPCISKIKPVAK